MNRTLLVFLAVAIPSLTFAEGTVAPIMPYIPLPVPVVAPIMPYIPQPFVLPVPAEPAFQTNKQRLNAKISQRGSDLHE